jgi:hypothetical protein
MGRLFTIRSGYKGPLFHHVKLVNIWRSNHTALIYHTVLVVYRMMGSYLRQKSRRLAPLSTIRGGGVLATMLCMVHAPGSTSTLGMSECYVLSKMKLPTKYSPLVKEDLGGTNLYG